MCINVYVPFPCVTIRDVISTCHLALMLVQYKSYVYMDINNKFEMVCFNFPGNDCSALGSFPWPNRSRQVANGEES